MSGSRCGNTTNPLFRNRNNAFAPITQLVPLLSSTYRTVDLELVVQLPLIRWRKIRNRGEVEGLVEKSNVHCMDFQSMDLERCNDENYLLDAFLLKLFLCDFQL